MFSKPLPELTAAAVSALSQIVRLQDADAAIPATAGAGADKQFRQGVAELRKAGVIRTYCNDYMRANHPGCVAVRFASAYKGSVTALGFGDVDCAPRFVTCYGTLVDSRPNYAN